MNLLIKNLQKVTPSSYLIDLDQNLTLSIKFTVFKIFNKFHSIIIKCVMSKFLTDLTSVNMLHEFIRLINVKVIQYLSENS